MKTRLKMGAHAFSLLEVMIAIGVFFVGAFAVLSLISSSLKNVSRLQRPIVDASPVAGHLLLTNKLVEDIYRVDMSDFLGKAYRGYRVTYEVRERETNKLFQVDFIVQSPDRGYPVISKMSALYFKPQSPAGSLDGGNFHR